MKKVFIQSNTRQLLGAKLAKYAIERNTNEPIDVEIINIDELEIFKEHNGTEYVFRGTDSRTYNLDDLQSFTLSRFMPPELMNYQGLAVVIDPDIFALSDIHELFSLDLNGKAIACCSKKDAWDTSVMLLDCSKLKHWGIRNILERLKNKTVDYMTVMTLSEEKSIHEIPRTWNSLDKLEEETKFLHTTTRLTQPWSTGLPIDFTINPMPKFFGIIPREPIHKLLGKYPTHYKQHPDKSIEKFFLELLKDALQNNVVTTKELEDAVLAKHLRSDIFKILEKV